jgi:uncharacterized repeat protein (TIGR03803 family)
MSFPVKACLAAVGLAAVVAEARAGYAFVESFTNQNDVGYYPHSSLVADGGVLYGTAEAGGTDGWGTLFKSTGGGDVSLIHSFSGGAGGDTPLGAVTVSGSTLYGMTASGGANNYGTLYKVGTDGSAFSVLHDFEEAAGDGATPLGGLVLGGSTLYGMTQGGGAHSLGAVFRVGTDGSGFTTIYEFSGTDGASPQGSLTLIGANLFGMTQSGGSGGGGVLFRVGTEGGFAVLHEFLASDVLGEGSGPRGSLTLVGDKFYGTTYSGGVGSNGVVFAIGTNGTGFATLHEFGDIYAVGDGAHPNSDLVLVGDKLYSTTLNGGGDGSGTLFEIGTNGTGFAVLHEFPNGVQTDVWGPYGSVAVDGSTLFGTARRGGALDTGGLYAYGLTPVPEPSVMVSVALGIAALVAARARRR